MIHIGPLTIHRYGLMYLFSILIGWGILRRLGRQSWFQGLVGSKISHILQYQFDELITYIVAGVIIGGRLGHVLIYDPNYYGNNLLEVIQLWKGGMSFVGGFIGVGLSVGYWVRQHKLTIRDFFILTDLIVLVLPIGIALGRIGNAINQELIGRIYTGTNSEQLHSLRLLRIYNSVDTKLRRNTNLMEGIGEGAFGLIVTLVLCIIQKIKKLRSPGYITGGFMIFYAIVRIILENLRDNPSSEYISIMNQIINKTQLWMIGFILIGVVIIMKGKRNQY